MTTISLRFSNLALSDFRLDWGSILPFSLGEYAEMPARFSVLQWWCRIKGQKVNCSTQAVGVD